MDEIENDKVVSFIPMYQTIYVQMLIKLNIIIEHLHKNSEI